MFKNHKWLALLALLALFGCANPDRDDDQDPDGDDTTQVDVPAGNPQRDDDGDGRTEDGGDCNDSDSLIYPGAAEGIDQNGDGIPEANGIDNDCDGVKDNNTSGYDDDEDGFSEKQGDCDDTDPDFYPHAEEVPEDGLDSDCDGADTDLSWDYDQDGFAASADCDDTDLDVYPNATELCNTLDDNCDGQVDEGINPPTFYRDFDGDGYGASTSGTTQACTAPVGYSALSGDCDDADVFQYPNAPEGCNGVDDDCDGVIDDGVQNTYYRDTDADGYGIPGTTTTACTLPVGYSTFSTDCNDSNASVKPGATETCNGIDDDCDGQTDEGVQNTYYRDLDNDGQGNSSSGTTTGCTVPAGYSASSTDCNDSSASVKPGATETCNGVDDDCDGTVDDGLNTTTYYRDADTDGYGGTTTLTACSQPSGYVSVGGDCNDSNASVKPGATESCNGVDDDCDGTIDEGLAKTYYADADADSFGNPAVNTSACAQPTNYTTDNTDCNDSSKSVYPGATEVTGDNIDQSCDGKETCFADADNDGARTTNTINSTDSDCNDSGEALATDPTGDCDDNTSSIYPGAVETCNSKDDDCDGTIDEGSTTTTFYPDGDGDGFGKTGSTGTASCSKPSGYATSATDCDDSNASVKPGATEAVKADGLDNNCDSCDLAGFVVVTVSGTKYCLAKWEASLDTTTGTSLPVSADEAVPWVNITLDQAKSAAALHGNGVQLASKATWQAGCKGDDTKTTKYDYSYGTSYVPGTCNSGGSQEGKLLLTGDYAGCLSQNGALDMLGNATEWIQEGDIWGGSVNTGEPSANCSIVHYSAPASSTSSSTLGFRLQAPYIAATK